MPRLTVLLVALVAVLGAGVAWLAMRPVPTSLSEAEVRSIVSAALAERDAAAPPSSPVAPETLNPLIESYLMSNPRILQQVGEALEREIRTAATAEARAALASMHAQIYEDPDHIIVGNPDGDVTLVEMFDYNCGFCRQSMPDIATLIAEDPNLRVILKEFPILSQDSVDAAKVGIAVAGADVDYWSFHEKLFTSRGQVTQATALAAASDLGLNPIELQLDVTTPRVQAVLDRSYAIARALNLSGTPTYIIGDEIIPGAVDISRLRESIANMRACGSTDCSLADTAPDATAPQGNG